MNNILNLTVSPVAIAIIGGGFSGSLRREDCSIWYVKNCTRL
ncbi:MAG: hypothetical protein RMY33_010895 [Nostoc sp. DedQUE03]|nr:hypothetical protein [Nostoc sp. DedQUE03]MDZ7974190.1 hypothetical protein [Nostoc sp. DedQUE03]MDZ8042845.1 hypothetical protein [Nostoc sp. DedQUE02]